MSGSLGKVVEKRRALHSGNCGPLCSPVRRASVLEGGGKEGEGSARPEVTAKPTVGVERGGYLASSTA